MFSYRPDQGVYARGTAFWAIAIYSYLAGQSFYYWSQRFSWFATKWTDEPIPVLGVHLTPALVTGVALCFSLVWFVAWRVANNPKISDLLIDTEAEMKKVTWPSMDDTKRSAVVVIGCTIFMLLFLFCSDTALDWILFEVLL